ncbi:hypothetical protein [Marinicella sp. W31]|uniref:hypothetical protein n=1 Tax=Marinicella sp. W31 TaxID=3023713 RepID=UPI003756AF1C
MKAGDSVIFTDKKGRDIMIIIPDAWPTLPIEAFFNGITVGRLAFDTLDSRIFLTEIYINRNFRSSGIVFELIKSALSLSNSWSVLPRLITNPGYLEYIESV